MQWGGNKWVQRQGRGSVWIICQDAFIKAKVFSDDVGCPKEGGGYMCLQRKKVTAKEELGVCCYGTTDNMLHLLCKRSTEIISTSFPHTALPMGVSTDMRKPIWRGAFLPQNFLTMCLMDNTSSAKLFSVMPSSGLVMPLQTFQICLVFSAAENIC